MKNFFTLGLVLCFCISVFAEPVSESEARKTALSLLKSEMGSNRLKSGKKLTSENLTLVKVNKDGNTPLFYVYNAENDGFVIVSGVKETAPILAYGLEKGIDMDNMSDATKIFLKSYAAALKEIAANPSSYQMSTKAETKEAIAPMIKTQWNQTYPYWNLLNFPLEERKDEFIQCVTGCPATATTMLMKYYYYKNGWFAGTKEEIPGYKIAYQIGDSVVDSMIVEALPAIEKFDWDNCNDKYSSKDNGENSELAVATVMRYCGQAQTMDYGAGESGSNEYYIVKGINDYLVGDDPFQAVLFSKKDYNDDDWWNILYNELKNERPVNIIGYGNGGHSFIFDGYESRDNGDYYHVNWGWSGVGDGYYRYDSLFAKITPGGADVMDLSSFNSIITFLTDDELKGYKEEYGVLDFFTSNGADFKADSIDYESYKLPVTFFKNDEEVNNIITIRTYYAPLKERAVLEPYFVVKNINDETSKPMFYAADESRTYNPNDTALLTYKLNLKELKDAMTTKGLSTGTGDVYNIRLKLSGDETVTDDYLSTLFQYYFKFSDEDTLQIIPQVIVDTLILSDYGINGMKAHFTVPEELRGQSYKIVGFFISHEIPITSDEYVTVQLDEENIEEDTEDGYLDTKNIGDGTVMSLAGEREFSIVLGNGLLVYTKNLKTIGYSASATQNLGNVYDSNAEYLVENTTFNRDDVFYFMDIISGIPSYNEDDGTWGYGASPKYGKIVMEANNDKDRVLLYYNTNIPLFSDSISQFLDNNKDEILQLYKNDYKTLAEKYTVRENNAISIPTGAILDALKKYATDDNYIYRFVTTVDSAHLLMPRNGLYFATYFRTNSDYSSLEIISPVEIPGDNADIKIQDSLTLSVTLKPVEGILCPRISVSFDVYPTNGIHLPVWTGTTKLKLAKENDVTFTRALGHNLEEGQTYLYELKNSNGILIAKGSFNATTGINEINAESDNNSTSAKYNGKKYNLAGQEVDSNYKGIVILNGAKHVQN